MTRVMPVLIIVSVLTGCARPRPKEPDFVGNWTVSETSRVNLPAVARKASAGLSLLENRTFSASELPMTLYLGPDVAPGPKTWVLSGSGSWRMVAREGEDQIELSFKSIKDGLGSRFPFETYSVPLRIANGELFYYEGDPDENKRIVFLKSERTK